MRVAVDNAGARVKISPDRSDRKLFIGTPISAAHNPGAVATDINGRSDFRRRIARAAQFHKHLQRDALFFSAWELPAVHPFSSGPGGPHPNPIAWAVRRNGTKGQSSASDPVPIGIQVQPICATLGTFCEAAKNSHGEEAIYSLRAIRAGFASGAFVWGLLVARKLEPATQAAPATLPFQSGHAGCPAD
jgi:hypothetical protein